MRARHLFSRIFSLTVPGAVILASSVLVGVWMQYVRPVAAPMPLKRQRLACGYRCSNPYGALFDPRFFSGSTPVSLAQSFPLDSTLS